MPRVLADQALGQLESPLRALVDADEVAPGVHRVAICALSGRRRCHDAHPGWYAIDTSADGPSFCAIGLMSVHPGRDSHGSEESTSIADQCNADVGARQARTVADEVEARDKGPFDAQGGRADERLLIDYFGHGSASLRRVQVYRFAASAGAGGGGRGRTSRNADFELK